MHVVICQCEEDLNYYAARISADLVLANPEAKFTFATGGTPLGAYRELVRLSGEEHLDFSLATAFHLDEYCGLSKEHPQSYRRYLENHLFDHLNFGVVHFLDGTAGNLQEECHRYDRLLQGGVDLLVAGIGPNGHLAFNEPPSDLDGTTHMQDLCRVTRDANARFFDGQIDQVPPQALTQGIKNIMDARQIIVLATGGGKAEAVRRAVEGPLTGMCPASALQRHPNATFLIDQSAAGNLQEKDAHAEHLDLDTLAAITGRPWNRTVEFPGSPISTGGK